MTPARAGTLAALALFAALAWHLNFICDDAFISFRYARHLAAGEGLRFNLGVEPPVEGYSNLLWVLAMAVVERVGADVADASRVVSVACGGLALLLVHRVVSARVEGFLAPLVAALACAAHPGFAAWSTSGLETMPCTLALVWGFERLVRDPDRPRAWQAGACFCAAAWLRADGAVLAGFVLAGALLSGPAPGGSLLGGSRGAIVRAGLCVAAAVGAQLVFRRLYHGAWGPNTASAKVTLSAVGLERGALYVGHLFVLLPTFPVAAVLGLLAPGEGRRLARAALVPALAVPAWYLAMGGDYMPFGRFLVPAIPFAAVALGAALGPSRARIPLAAVALGAIAATLLPAFGLAVAPRALLDRLDFRFGEGEGTELERCRLLNRGVARGTELGRALALVTDPGDSIVAGNVGAKAYHCDLFFHDRHGLVSREVAERDAPEERRMAGHARGVRSTFFLHHEPTLLEAVIESRGPILRQLPPELDADYEIRRIPLRPADGFERRRKLAIVVRRDSDIGVTPRR